MNPIVLFREDLDSEGEAVVCRKYLPTVRYRTEVPPDSLVVGRYSVLPYYRELYRELQLQGSRLVNSPVQHEWIADVLQWAAVPNGALAGITPRTWSDWARLPDGAYVLKGRTNSRKHQWNTHMFAPTLEDVPRVAARLLDDALIKEQGVVVREYVPLKQIGEGLNGLPVTNEWRVFFLNLMGKMHQLARGFYWKGSHPELEDKASFTQTAQGVVEWAAHLCSPYAQFFVLDVAETEDGDWLVVEVNDGQMSGLCGVNPHEFYFNLAGALHAP